MAVTVVVAYDISEDLRRARAAATIQRVGDRIQRSVYLCAADSPELDELMTRLLDVIDPDTDSVYMLHQCLACWDKVRVLGQATVEPPALYWGVL
jgi:CRISPR-associated protein Cas2